MLGTLMLRGMQTRSTEVRSARLRAFRKRHTSTYSWKPWRVSHCSRQFKISKMRITTAFVFGFLLLTVNAYSQQMLDAKTMKLSEISTDKKYGFVSTRKQSIKVGKIENEIKFINALTGPNGESIRAIRRASCCQFRSKSAAFGSGYLDKWEVWYEGLAQPIILYLNGYEYEEPKCPVGLNFKKK